MLFKLRLKVGSHVERDANGAPKLYESGDIVKSDQNLCKLFTGKFDRIDRDDESKNSKAIPNIPMPSKGVDLITPAPLHSVSDEKITATAAVATKKSDKDALTE